MLMLPGLTCELTNKKCICKNVKSPCSTGWTKTTSFRQAPSIMECIAISRPLNTKVPSPNAETCELKALLLQYHLHETSWSVAKIQWLMILFDPRKSYFLLISK